MKKILLVLVVMLSVSACSFGGGISAGGGSNGVGGGVGLGSGINF